MAALLVTLMYRKSAVSMKDGNREEGGWPRILQEEVEEDGWMVSVCRDSEEEKVTLGGSGEMVRSHARCHQLGIDEFNSISSLLLL